MKRLLLAAVLFSACSNGRNELMTRLVNDKKKAEDSIKIAHNYEGYYYDKAKQQMHGGADSNIWHQTIDTSTLYGMIQRRLAKKVESLDFSIDSLGKMK